MFIGICSRSQVSVYRITGPLVKPHFVRFDVFKQFSVLPLRLSDMSYIFRKQNYSHIFIVVLPSTFSYSDGPQQSRRSLIPKVPMSCPTLSSISQGPNHSQPSTLTPKPPLPSCTDVLSLYIIRKTCP